MICGQVRVFGNERGLQVGGNASESSFSQLLALFGNFFICRNEKLIRTVWIAVSLFIKPLQNIVQNSDSSLKLGSLRLSFKSLTMETRVLYWKTVIMDLRSRIMKMHSDYII